MTQASRNRKVNPFAHVRVGRNVATPHVAAGRSGVEHSWAQLILAFLVHGEVRVSLCHRQGDFQQRASLMLLHHVPECDGRLSSIYLSHERFALSEGMGLAFRTKNDVHCGVAVGCRYVQGLPTAEAWCLPLAMKVVHLIPVPTILAVGDQGRTPPLWRRGVHRIWRHGWTAVETGTARVRAELRKRTVHHLDVKGQCRCREIVLVENAHGVPRACVDPHRNAEQQILVYNYLGGCVCGFDMPLRENDHGEGSVCCTAHHYVEPTLFSLRLNADWIRHRNDELRSTPL
mmetsp:Transcript_50783/g.135458  ORF Transcript_50783/g.135458 Transcript_50783/m.135458 type:complete len:288 (-) Transcript_50783:940-1803(-)